MRFLRDGPRFFAVDWGYAFLSIYHEVVIGGKSKTAGVTAAGRERIRFDFKFAGVRYRPTLLRAPTE
jgi:hypothetical protein